MSDLRRVGYGTLAVIAALLILRDPPPTWFIWLLLLAVGISGYLHHRKR